MSKEPSTDLKEKAAFATRPERRDALSLTSRDAKGKMLFTEHEVPVSFHVHSWEWFTGSGQEPQVALVVTEPSGQEFIFPLGKTNQYVISDVGITNPDELIGATIYVETYETGSTGAFAVGKRICGIELAAPPKK